MPAFYGFLLAVDGCARKIEAEEHIKYNSWRHRRPIRTRRLLARTKNPNLDLVQGLPANFWPGWQRWKVHQQLREAKMSSDGTCNCVPGVILAVLAQVSST